MNQPNRITGQPAPTTPAIPARFTHPLLALIPARQLTGYLIEVIEVGEGIVTVIATPDSEWGAYEITGWRHLSESETAIEVADASYPGEPFDLVIPTSSESAQGHTEIDAKVANAVTFLTTRLAEVAGMTPTIPARRLFAAGVKHGNGRLVIQAVSA